jgi:hypothetical protein
MIERGASALAHLHEYDPNTIPVQLWPAVRDRYRRDAETVLRAVLDASEHDPRHALG